MKEFKSPNVKAPRYRPEVFTIMDKEFFENFKKKHPKYKNLDNKDLRKIIKGIIINMILLNYLVILLYVILFIAYL